MKITRTELVWPGKYDDDGNRVLPPRVSLPFQVVETVNVSRASREAASRPQQSTLFDYWDPQEGTTFEDGWRNKLIWGDNLLVMNSLLDQFAGKIDLIYIDPPFLTGADFSFRAEIGEEEDVLTKTPSAVEEKAYRDTWSSGVESYITMLSSRLVSMRELLSDTGSLYLHIGPGISSYVKALLDEVFGSDRFLNEIIWRRTSAHNDPQRYGAVAESILFYAKSSERFWNPPKIQYEDWYIDRYYRYTDSRGRRFLSRDLTAPAHGRSSGQYEWRGKWPPRGRMWAYTFENMQAMDLQDRVFYTTEGIPRLKQYLDEMQGSSVQSIWDDILPIVSWSQESTGYETQKPEALLERIINASSPPGGLVADIFVGSGTTAAVAEKLGRRWIAADLSRWSTHVTRKRLLDIQGCKPFEILNLGKYERQYWQGVTFGADSKERTQQAVFQYLAFVLRLYKAEPVAGMEHIHGRRGTALVHIGAVDAPVTIDEIQRALDECAAVKQKELHVLGWEWEMGLAGPNNDVKTGGLMHAAAKEKGIKLILLQIPREVMEEQAAAKGDVQFFELAYLDVAITKPKKLTAVIELKDFVIPNTDLIPEDVRAKVTKWSDYIDYWSVDWDFQNDTFIQGFVTYRTRKNRKLAQQSDPHTYEKPGQYRVVVKVIDIFGNDTSQGYTVDV